MRAELRQLRDQKTLRPSLTRLNTQKKPREFDTLASSLACCPHPPSNKYYLGVQTPFADQIR